MYYSWDRIFLKFILTQGGIIFDFFRLKNNILKRCHSFEDAKYYTGIQVNEGFKSLFGNNGKIYVYDDITDELILTITDTEKHIFADECSKEIYKSIRIETSSVVNPVKYNVAIHETIYGKEQITLKGMPIEVAGFSPKTTVEN